jgi:hypothetical protein
MGSAWIRKRDDMTMAIPAPVKAPLWYWATAGLGLVWNAYGVLQFTGSLSATEDSLMAGGMTADQAQVMLTYPTWMTLAFGLGVFGGLIGAVLLLLRRREALAVLAVSLAAYVVLHVGEPRAYLQRWVRRR